MCELLQLLYYSFSSLCNFDPICNIVIYFLLVLNFVTVICVLSIKKKKKKTFDVAMGSYDGAETCEFIGAYMLSLIASKFKNEVGLYRDDGLAICKATPKKIEKTKQEVSQVFKSNGLKITIDANKKIVNLRCDLQSHKRQLQAIYKAQ